MISLRRAGQLDNIVDPVFLRHEQVNASFTFVKDSPGL